METASVFLEGPQAPKVLNIQHSSSLIKPPKPLVVVHPSQPGQYPVVVFFHGFLCSNVFYTCLFQHIASHEYIIVAPQMYDIPIWWHGFTPNVDATQEIADAVALTEWLPNGLSNYLPPDIRPDFQKMVVAGHSRGGKVAFGAALRSSSSVKYWAIIGVDPVDGLDSKTPIDPPLLNDKVHALGQGIPVLVIGSGITDQKLSPDGMNHQNFFKKCSAPAYHFVVKNCRHLDFLDDGSEFTLPGVTAWLVGEACHDREARQKIRSFAGGMIVAFLNAYVKNDHGDLNGVVEDPSAAPVEIKHKVKKEKPAIRSRL